MPDLFQYSAVLLAVRKEEREELMEILSCRKCSGLSATYYFIQGYACWLCFTCAQEAKHASKETVALGYSEKANK